MITAIGALGVLVLSLCTVQLLVRTIRDGHANGVDPWFLGYWLGGLLLMLVHTVGASAPWPVILNYGLNTLMVGVVGWYRWFK